MGFSPTQLTTVLTLPPGSNLLVGYSGGLDSTVLLHALVKLRDADRLPGSLRAIHVDHQLQQDSGQWRDHCEVWCRKWQVPLITAQVDLEQGSGSIEARARAARYAAFTKHLDSGSYLLLAHHRDDQMETLLLRLMRGAGMRGLAGIPQQRELAEATLLRPLLETDRAALRDYAEAEELQWIEDGSNENTDLDRNFLRHEILPRLQSRWSGYRESWSKTTALAKESGALLEDLASLDLARLRSEDTDILNTQLPLAGVAQLSEARQRNLLRFWLEQAGLPDPGWQGLQQLVSELVPAGADSAAQMELGDVVLRVFQKYLYIVPRLPEIDGGAEFSWQPGQQPELVLPGNGRLRATAATGAGISQQHCSELLVRYRQGGEDCSLPGRPRKPLKKLLQEQAVEPWLRSRMPLLFQQDELVCVPVIGVSANASAAPDEAGWLINWEPPEVALKHTKALLLKLKA